MSSPRASSGSGCVPVPVGRSRRADRPGGARARVAPPRLDHDLASRGRRTRGDRSARYALARARASGGVQAFASLTLAAPFGFAGIATLAEALSTRLAVVPDLYGAASALPDAAHGLGVRLAGRDRRAVSAGVARVWTATRVAFHGAPPPSRRKGDEDASERAAFSAGVRLAATGAAGRASSRSQPGASVSRSLDSQSGRGSGIEG
jgi:hypothetical protein